MSETCEKSALIIGKFYKVHLPGESPWAQCLAVLPNGDWVGRINNLLVAQSIDLRKQIAQKFGSDEPLPSLHSYRQNDRVIFTLRIEPEFQIWVPAEPAGGYA